jgi:hypothetical protein
MIVDLGHTFTLREIRLPLSISEKGLAERYTEAEIVYHEMVNQSGSSISKIRNSF